MWTLPVSSARRWAGADAEQAVDRAHADGAGHQRDDADVAPRADSAGSGQADEDEPSNDAQTAVDNTFIEFHLRSSFGWYEYTFALQIHFIVAGAVT